jgi:hypothetical protein
MSDQQHNRASSSAPSHAAGRARLGAHDEEVYGTLGALLGTLEVIATDDHQPLSPQQAERMQGALRLGNGLQAQVEALLMLADEQLHERLSRAQMAMRPLIEHAVRGALRSFEKAAVALVLPTGEWGRERVRIDSSRVDRTLRALAEQLAARVGDGGVIEVGIQQRSGVVALTLRGRVGARDKPLRTSLVEAGARKLFALHGGALRIDDGGLIIEITLPASEAP